VLDLIPYKHLITVGSTPTTSTNCQV